VILTFEFRAEADRWRVRITETGFKRDVPNLMAYDSRGQVVSIGEDPGEFRGIAARVVAIYDPVRFDPVNTARSVRYYTMLASGAVRRGLAHVLDLFDRYDLIFELPGYSDVPARVRQTFEHELDTMTFVRSSSINGRVRKLPWNIFRRQ
jgi:hypothetical protein